MEQYLARQKALELRIDQTQVVREYWELIVLKGLYESPSGRCLVFKEGTALRLATCLRLKLRIYGQSKPCNEIAV